jgi:hypothetical protein
LLLADLFLSFRAGPFNDDLQNKSNDPLGRLASLASLSTAGAVVECGLANILAS